MKSLLHTALIAATTLSVACGPHCQSTCQTIYGDEIIYSTQNDACGITVPGKDPDDSRRDCITECQNALDVAGDIGDYNPFDPANSGSGASLENEQQAGVWMDCVDQSSCQDLRTGTCAPISF